MTAVLLCWAVALWLEGTAGLHSDVPVLAVALAFTLASSQRTADTRRRLTALVLLPATAAVAQFVGRLIMHHYAVGAAVFTAGISLPIWIRRYGRVATKAGTLMTLPFNIASRCPVMSVPSGLSRDGVPTCLSVVGRTYEPVAIYLFGAVIYFVINYLLSLASRALEQRFAFIRE